MHEMDERGRVADLCARAADVFWNARHGDASTTEPIETELRQTADALLAALRPEGESVGPVGYVSEEGLGHLSRGDGWNIYGRSLKNATVPLFAAPVRAQPTPEWRKKLDELLYEFQMRVVEACDRPSITAAARREAAFNDVRDHVLALGSTGSEEFRAEMERIAERMGGSSTWAAEIRRALALPNAEGER